MYSIANSIYYYLGYTIENTDEPDKKTLEYRSKMIEQIKNNKLILKKINASKEHAQENPVKFKKIRKTKKKNKQ